MKKCITLILILINLYGYSQNEQVLYANKKNNVFLHFKTSIDTGIVGSDDFVFIFNKNDDTKFGIIKGIKPGSESTNLLVTTKSGMIYSFILKFEKKLSNFNHFIKPSSAINYVEKQDVLEVKNDSITQNNSENKIVVTDQHPKKTDTIYNIQSLEKVKNLYKYQKEKYFRNKCMGLTTQKPYYFKSLVSRNGLTFQLADIKYDKNELYFSYLIKNKRTMDVKVDNITYEITSKSLKKRTSSQAIEVKPIFSYQSPMTINGKTTIRYVVVFKQFTISKKKVFLTSIKETNGERDIYIPISSKQVNNPN